MALATQPNAVLQKAQEGDAASQNAVGEWCYNGTNGMKRDYGQALQWWAKAAKQGEVKAVGNVGMCDLYGYGLAEGHSAVSEINTRRKRLADDCR